MKKGQKAGQGGRETRGPVARAETKEGVGREQGQGGGRLGVDMQREGGEGRARGQQAGEKGGPRGKSFPGGDPES